MEPTARRPRFSRPAAVALREALFPVVLVQAWVWLSPYPRSRSLDGLVALAVLLSCSLAVLRHGPSDRRAFGLGPAQDHVRAARPILIFTVLGTAVLAALASRRARAPDLNELLFSLARYPFSGLLQQGLVLGVLLPRLTLAAGPRAAPWATAALFALAHLPNPVLVGGGFVQQAFLAHVWRRAPSLPLAALCHGVLGAMLDEALDVSLRIGRGYLAL